MFGWKSRGKHGLASKNGRLLELMEEISTNVTHIHNLQHSIITEIMMATLRREYESLGSEKVFDFQFEGKPISMYLPTGPADLIQRDILQNRSFFHVESLRMIQDHVPMSGSVVLDIGAYIGNHTVFFSKICGAAKVISFEPVKNSFVALQKNVLINGIDAELKNIGLGDRAAKAKALINASNGGGTALELGQLGQIEIQPLDALDMPLFSFVKIDVEGMAPEVLKGARETILRNKPIVVVEAFPNEFERVDGIMKSLNYSKKATVSDDHVYYVNK